LLVCSKRHISSSLASLWLEKLFMIDQVNAMVFGVHFGSGVMLGCPAVCVVCSPCHHLVYLMVL
jgi:hypothetical protein